MFSLFSTLLAKDAKELAAKKRKENAAAKKEAAILKKVTTAAKKSGKRKATIETPVTPARVSKRRKTTASYADISDSDMEQ